ncbi:MAG: hypothetical protein QOE64_266 [Frankiales bacterium]|jgi:hypothetical protein|nr:hypothetical protein [Frankiales bacterium]
MTLPTKRLTGLIAVPLILLAAGCGGGGVDGSSRTGLASTAGKDVPAGAEAPLAGAAAGQPVAALVLDNRKLIRTAGLELAVKDVSKAVRAAEKAVTDAGGAVYAEDVSHDGKGADRASLTLKVPPARYGSVLDDLATSLGSEIARTQDVKDVTQEVVDVGARLDVQRKTITRVKLLLDRASKISDIVELETELSKREADYESMLTRQRTLASQTDLATIELTIHRNDTSVLAATLNPKPGSDKGFFTGLKAGWSAFLAFGSGLLTAVGAVLPFAVAAGLVALGVLALLRRRRPSTAPSAAGGVVD